MDKEYVAIQLSGKIKQGGFGSEDEAWDWIYGRDCEDCKRLRMEGSPFGGACSAEWDVVTREKLDSWDSNRSNCMKKIFRNY